MLHKCEGCIYKTDWDDESGIYPICERLYIFSFKEATDECAKPGPCEYRVSQEDLDKLIEKWRAAVN